VLAAPSVGEDSKRFRILSLNAVVHSRSSGPSLL
jgi:hypothetical protein